MEFLNEYVVAIVMGICLVTGFILKHVFASEQLNRFIPLIMGALGVAVNIWVNNCTVDPDILLGGLVSGLASTGMHQMFKQFIDKSE